MFINRFSLLLVLSFVLSGCQEDLFPSNDPLANKASIQTGSTVEDLTFTLSDNSEQTLSNLLTTHEAVVLYFTMWCPVCDSHMSHFRNDIRSQHPTVHFIFVDYVSGSVTYARDSQVATGYTDFDVIADYDNYLEDYFNATMATTVIIDKNFVVQYKGLFKTTSDIHDALNLI